MMRITTYNGRDAYILEFKKGDTLDVSLYAMGELIESRDDGKNCIRIFARG